MALLPYPLPTKCVPSGMKPFLLFCCCLLVSFSSWSQTNIHFTQPVMDSILKGNYNPADYAPAFPVSDPNFIANQIQAIVSPDSLQAHLEMLTSFGNRNTGSDTSSNTFGIGAARRWAHQKFTQFSNFGGNRLQVGYLQFETLTCNVNQHRNVVAVFPGQNPSTEGFVLIEAHLDSRCDDVCDSLCLAYGADDNGSGSALVLELARTLTLYSFDETVVFMLTTGEEQGLLGARALSDYCDANNIPVKAVLNNDIVGGVSCGQTASPPACIGAGQIDSINVRLFSRGNYNSQFKQFARYTKLQYEEILSPIVSVPTSIQIMTGEDRSGRGGDHIPFRENGFTAIRMTSANEHGDGSAGPGYTDRQHTSSDSLGLDLNNDGQLDTFFVDFNYLARNAVINGVCATMVAQSTAPITSFTATAIPGGLAIQVNNPTTTRFRLATRTSSNDWDSVYTLNNAVDTVWGIQGQVIVSMAALATDNVESLFSYETNVNVPTATGEVLPSKTLELMGNRPNPFDEQTTITVKRHGHLEFKTAVILIHDAAGREVQRIPMTLEADVNEVNFYHGFHAAGTYYYSLVVDGEVYDSGKMVMQ